MLLKQISAIVWKLIKHDYFSAVTGRSSIMLPLVSSSRKGILNGHLLVCKVKYEVMHEVQTRVKP